MFDINNSSMNDFFPMLNWYILKVASAKEIYGSAVHILISTVFQCKYKNIIT